MGFFVWERDTFSDTVHIKEKENEVFSKPVYWEVGVGCGFCWKVHLEIWVRTLICSSEKESAVTEELLVISGILLQKNLKRTLASKYLRPWQIPLRRRAELQVWEFCIVTASLHSLFNT